MHLRSDTHNGTPVGPPPVTCTHRLGSLPCLNTAPHEGNGRGCFHDAGDVPDDHDRYETTVGNG